MNNKTDNNFLFLLIVISIIIGTIALIYYNPFFKWMGRPLDTKELTVTQMEFTTLNDSNIIIVHATNSGIQPITVDAVRINDETQNKITGDSIHGPTFEPGDSGTIIIEYDWVTGTKYAVNGFTSDGTMVMAYTDTA